MTGQSLSVPASRPVLLWLKRTLWVKIIFTLGIWALPPLVAPGEWFSIVGIPAPQPLIFVKLMAVAFLALVVIYAYGLREARAGRVLIPTVAAGIVSNGGACVGIVLSLLLTDEIASFRWPGRCLFYGSALVLALITVSLVTIVMLVRRDGRIIGGA